jgi:hypothetical protein
MIRRLVVDSNVLVSAALSPSMASSHRTTTFAH